MNHLPIPLSRQEKISGSVYLAISILILPSILTFANLQLGLSAGRLNFLFYSINFLSVLVIFRSFLWKSVQFAAMRPLGTLWWALLSYLGHLTLGDLIMALIFTASPDFVNVNDQNVLELLSADYRLMVLGTCLLVPVAEETLYRGLLFRGLYDRSPFAAYAVSILTFAAIHVVGYIGIYPPLQLLLCLIQYLPAGYCLCFAYRRSGTIIAPILMHIIVNTTALFQAGR